MMHPASFLRILFILHQRTIEFLNICSLSMFGYFLLRFLEGCMVQINNVTTAPFPIIRLLQVMIFVSKKCVLLLKIKWPPYLDLSSLNFQGKFPTSSNQYYIPLYWINMFYGGSNSIFHYQTEFSQIEWTQSGREKIQSY